MCLVKIASAINFRCSKYILSTFQQFHRQATLLCKMNTITTALKLIAPSLSTTNEMPMWPASVNNWVVSDVHLLLPVY